MNNCCICGKPFKNEEDFGNNPFPLCAEDDRESRCCDDCNNLVISARLIQIRGKKTKKININDTIVILYSAESEEPKQILKDTGKFLAGHVTNDEALPEGCYEGDWGNFLLNTKTDNYIVIE